MRKLFLFMMISLDGYFEGPDHDLSWHNADNQEFNDYAVEQTDSAGTLLFGRKTYEGMQSWWTSDFAKQTDPIVTELMNTTPKVVFSHTLDTADWENTTLVKDSMVEEVARLKQQPGKDIAVYGSSNLCVGLLEAGLLDELRIMVNPVVIGAGTPLFAGIKTKLNLELLGSKQFKSGNVLLTYKPV